MQKNKFLILLLLVGLTFFSCKKNKTTEENISEQPTGKTDEPAPSSFEQKALIEEFTGEWCGYCPSGAQYLQSTIADYPGKVVAAAFHTGDPFEISASGTFANKFNVTGYPSALIQRKQWNGVYAVDRSLWSNYVGQVLQQSAAEGGLKIKTLVTNNHLDISVDMAVNTNVDHLYLSVYLVEDNVPESSQDAQAGAPPGYIHHHVMRKTLDISKEFPFTQGFITREVISNVDISSYDQANLKVVAYLHHWEAGNYEVINAQEIAVGQNSDWN